MHSIVRKWVAPAAFVILACALVAAVILYVLYTPAYAVSVDGEDLGIAADTDQVDSAVKSVEDRVSDILDEDYEIGGEIVCEPVLVLKTDVTDADEIEQRLFDAVPDVTEDYVLKVDGEPVGIGDPEQLQQIVEDAANEYVNENTVEVTVLSETEIAYEAVPADLDDDPEAIADTLTSVTEEAVVYTAQEGDTIETIIEENDVSAEELASLNPELEDVIAEAVTADSDGENAEEPDGQEQQEETETPLEEGTNIVLAPEQCVLIVETRDYVSHEEELPFETETVQDDSLYVDQSEVRTEGQNGTVLKYESITYQNGVEISRRDSQQIITLQPVTRVVAVGTKEYPAPEQTPAADTSAQKQTSGTSSAASDTASNSSTSSNNNTSNNTSNSTSSDKNTSNNASSNTSNTSSGTASSSSNTSSSSAASSESTTSTQSSASASTSSSGAAATRQQLVSYAKQYLGYPYSYGGSGPYSFDCSGFTYYVYAHFGYSLARTVPGQMAQGTYVPLNVSSMQPGDLLFWSYGGSTPTHVGIYIGNGQYIQATKPGDVVRINTVASYAGQPLIACRRIIN